MRETQSRRCAALLACLAFAAGDQAADARAAAEESARMAFEARQRAERAPEQVDLPVMPIKKHLTGFSNPFQQYEGGAIPGWQYGGDTQLFNDYASITPAAANKIGWIWATEEAEVPNGWEAELEFHIGGAKQRGAGGGLGFWLTTEPLAPGTMYGHSASYTGLGIFFDTYEAHEHDFDEEVEAKAEPYIVAVVNDGTALHSSTGVEEVQDYYARQIGVCFAQYRNLEKVARMRVVWLNGVLEIFVDLEHTRNYQSCMKTDPQDVRAQNIPKSGYFGLSASTGGYGDAHVVYALELAKLDKGEEVVATPHVAAAGEAPVPAEHAVHHESADHQTKVKLEIANEIKTEVEDDPKAAEKEPVAPGPRHPIPAPGDPPSPSHTHPEYSEAPIPQLQGHAFPEHNPVHLPPVQEQSEQVDHLLRSLESSKQVLESLSALSDSMDAKAAEHGAKLSAVSLAVDTFRDAMGTSVSQIAEVEAILKAEMHTSAIEIGEVHAASNYVKQMLERHTALLEDLAQRGNRQEGVGELRRDIESLRKLTEGMVGDIRAEAAQVRELLNREPPSAGYTGGVLPLLVCGQLLVVAAVLSFRGGSPGAKKERYGHLG